MTKTFTVLFVLALAVGVLALPSQGKLAAIFESGKPGSKNIDGFIKFEETDNGINVSLEFSDGLPDEFGPFPYHVHEKPVPDIGDCGPFSVGDHIDLTTAPNTFNCSAVQDKSLCQAGDLSGKYGKLVSDDGAVAFTTYTDPFLQFDGSPKGLLNRSIVIHMLNTTRYACASIVQFTMSADDQLAKDFESACKFLGQSSSALDDTIKLKFYGYYKTATIGKCTASKPSFFDFVGREKWNAWKAVDELDKEEAMRKYIELLESLNVGWDVNWEAGADEVKNKESRERARIGGVAVSTLACASDEEEDNDELDRQDIFYFAKTNNSAELVELLKSNTIDINAKDAQGFAPLHWAADRGHLDIVKILIANNANVNILTNENENPLHFACISEHRAVAQYLYKCGSDPSLEDNDQLTPLDYTNDGFKEAVLHS
ncbi:6921_t:CDS:10 [Paraglomus brasilianum]|uniref:6921_t:CDS:1 n=1 Tax=Paraglomus brasilianum TaxID=144538 RepID=A0A9N9C800_9GLOM|nr:6921_t:CDS:10 [Paraglomus brasilianum]